MAVTRELFRDPRAVGADLQRDTADGPSGEDDGHAALVAKVEADGLRDEIRGILSHGWSPVWAT